MNKIKSERYGKGRRKSHSQTHQGEAAEDEDEE
jgi:hypothetical protein